MIRRPWGGALAVAVLLALQAASAHATIILMPGNVSQPDEANVLLTNKVAGTTITGTTNTSPAFLVDISSTQFLFQQGSGQANVIATTVLGEPKTQVGLTNFSITLSPGQSVSTFGDLIFDANVNNGGGQPGTGGTATISGTDNLGNPFSFPNMSIGNGENFFTLVGVSGESLQSVNFTMTSGDITSLKQVRISGLGATVIPEPSTLISAATAALLGLVYARRQRRAKAA